LNVDDTEYFLFPKVTHSYIAFWPGIPQHPISGHSCLFRNYKNLIHGWVIIYRARMNVKRNSGICAHPESLGNAGIHGHSCLFRNYKYHILTVTHTLTLTLFLEAAAAAPRRLWKINCRYRHGHLWYLSILKRSIYRCINFAGHVIPCLCRRRN